MDNIFPLAEKMRPNHLTQCEGQEHLTGKGKILYSFLQNKKITSLIFWGPPGTGKTTISRILVNELSFPSIEFSATVSKIGEVRDIMTKAIQVKKMEGKPLVVFVDEIHHFNKHSQDAFLPFVERGDIILIGTTIENPAFKINRALLSRIKILEFNPLNFNHLEKILNNALSVIQKEAGLKLHLTQNVKNMIVDSSIGDARRLLNLIEIIASVKNKSQKINEKMVHDIIQKKMGAYDRSGDDRYQLISAFHKSIRNSDCDASLFWLYRMIEGGEDPLYIIRRMIRIAVEDIGFADLDALIICLNIKSAYEYLGSPEGDLFLTQGCIYLASAPKSNSLYITEKKMKKIVEKYKYIGVPLHLINPSNFIASQKGAGKGYKYAHDFKEKTTDIKTIPDEVKESDFYIPNEIGFEKKIKERIEYWKKIKSDLEKKK
jgi:putative ATPase